MFQIQLTIKSVKNYQGINEKARFYFKIEHFYYFISDFIHFESEQTEINITHKFQLREEKPQFQLLLVITEGDSKKVLGKSSFNVRQWPIDEEKLRVVEFSPLLSVVVVIKNTYVTSLPQPQRSSNSQMDQMQSMQKQLQIRQHYAFIKAKNQKLQEQLHQLKEQHEQLIFEKAIRQKTMRQREAERLLQLQEKKRELDKLKSDLQQMNIQMGAIINLVNNHGQIDICNKVLDLLVRTSSQEE